MSDLIKCGYLEMKLPRKHRKFGLKVWRQKWFTLRRKSGKKQHRLEYHKSEESCLKGKHTTIIPLQSLIAIELATSKTHEHVFKLVFRDGIKSLFFSTHNENEMKEWIRIIRKLIFPEPKAIPVTHGTSPEGFYSVTIVCTEDSEKLSLAGDYLLSVSPEHLKLCKRETQNIVAIQWHLEDIPRFRLQRLCHLHDGEKIFIINVARFDRLFISFIFNSFKEGLQHKMVFKERFVKIENNELSTKTTGSETKREATTSNVFQIYHEKASCVQINYSKSKFILFTIIICVKSPRPFQNWQYQTHWRSTPKGVNPKLAFTEQHFATLFGIHIERASFSTVTIATLPVENRTAVRQVASCREDRLLLIERLREFEIINRKHGLSICCEVRQRRPMQIDKCYSVEYKCKHMEIHEKPPKKKGGKKGKKKAAKAKTPTIIDGISTEEMSKEQLEEHIVRLREELDREREERNYFQLERDKVNTFWEITKRQLEEKKAELRNKEREMEEAEERHQVEIKVYKQKVKHLLYEHQNNITELKAESAVALKLAQDEHRGNEQGLGKDKRSLKVELKEQELAHEDIIKNLKRGKDEDITQLRDDFERQAKEIEAKYEKKMRALREELELRRKTEIHEIEERKNSQINTLMKNHEKAFSDIKNYYNDITLNNLALINSLKEQVEEMKRKEERMEKQMNEIMAENRRLTEPLQRAREEVQELQRELANYHKDKASLASAKARLKVRMEELKKLEWEHEVLKQRFEQTQSERDELYGKFVKSIHEVQQKSNFKNLLLEKKLTALADTLEKKEAQLNEVLAASNLDPTALTVVTRKLEDVLDSKNSAIKDLQYELARVCKAHNDLIRTYEAKLQSFGVPTDELGFKPLESNVAGQQLGRGPAGLVAQST
eukprot:Seg1005.10 transcript_id=Seg1005.10/GoldUCD/mRNA.D3Y31 product="Dynein regulatory complex subunit 4" protein_id=Seg1005.10/GoldUCD/D3Y31